MAAAGTLRAGSAEALSAFTPLPEQTYLDTASYGLPPKETVGALERALADWASGRAQWSRDWDPAGDDCRRLVAPLLGSRPDRIALMPAGSSAVALVGSGLRANDEVVVPDDEFTSVLYPLLVAAGDRGARVRRVPYDRLGDAVTPATTMLAFSHVRSNGGYRQDLRALADAAHGAGATILVDATHSAGLLPVPSLELGLDHVVVSAYKHLLCPRGVAFLHVAEAAQERMRPLSASWRGAVDLRPYGGDLGDLLPDAARFDVSLAWHPWVGARSSLGFLSRFDPADLESWVGGLATGLAKRLGVEPTGSSVLTIPVSIEPSELGARLEVAGIRAALNGPGVRFSFHLYNTPEDMERAAAFLEGMDLGTGAR
ncbi:MAG TPA: aminotransferase class V-fold PLP-dependent enzyme [Candidatus Dormibacteraeota bacterium]|nr:aminotransferase class V-fold PLP-dependent enzyme [Candidatus Dormibacteraeota bacterium]